MVYDLVSCRQTAARASDPPATYRALSDGLVLQAPLFDPQTSERFDAMSPLGGLTRR